MDFTVEFDTASVKAKIQRVAEAGTEMLANELLKDANYYAREDTGELIRSSIRASNIKKGELIWDTPYAKRVYYTGFPAKDRNPNASLLWAEKASKENSKKYIRMLEKIVESEV